MSQSRLLSLLLYPLLFIAGTHLVNAQSQTTENSSNSITYSPNGQWSNVALGSTNFHMSPVQGAEITCWFEKFDHVQVYAYVVDAASRLARPGALEIWLDGERQVVSSASSLSPGPVWTSRQLDVNHRYKVVVRNQSGLAVLFDKFVATVNGAPVPQAPQPQEPAAPTVTRIAVPTQAPPPVVQQPPPVVATSAAPAQQQEPTTRISVPSQGEGESGSSGDSSEIVAGPPQSLAFQTISTDISVVPATADGQAGPVVTPTFGIIGGDNSGSGTAISIYDDTTPGSAAEVSQQSSKKKLNNLEIVAVVLGILVILVSLFWVLLCYRRRKAREARDTERAALTAPPVMRTTTRESSYTSYSQTTHITIQFDPGEIDPYGTNDDIMEEDELTSGSSDLASPYHSDYSTRWSTFQAQQPIDIHELPTPPPPARRA